MAGSHAEAVMFFVGTEIRIDKKITKMAIIVGFFVIIGRHLNVSSVVLIMSFICLVYKTKIFG